MFLFAMLYVIFGFFLVFSATAVVLLTGKRQMLQDCGNKTQEPNWTVMIGVCVFTTLWFWTFTNNAMTVIILLWLRKSYISGTVQGDR